MVGRPHWNDTWLEFCEIMSKQSTCTRRQVGAVVVKDNRVISSGYNGAPPKQPHCIDGACPRGLLEGPLPEDYEKYPCIAVHAELNALLRAGSMAKGAILYCTHKPCLQCQNAIMGAEIEEVLWWECAPPIKFTTWYRWIPSKGLINGTA